MWGGDRLYHIDIRIIAATNQDLWDQVEKGRFRRDLFYRLNVLPIRIPPLRERKGDILFLIDRFKESGQGDFQLSPGASRLLAGYAWEGNIRELRNLVNFLINLSKATIEAQDCRSILKWPDPPLPEFLPAPPAPTHGPGGNASRHHFIQACLFESEQNRVWLGRRSITHLAADNGLFLTEAQIRRMLREMEELGLVRCATGRIGTTITPLGINVLQRPAPL